MKPILKQGGSGRYLNDCCGRSIRIDAARRADRIRIGSGAAGIERLEAYFQGPRLRPHRHDTYMIGITVAGVQTFLDIAVSNGTACQANVTSLQSR